MIYDRIDSESSFRKEAAHMPLVLLGLIFVVGIMAYYFLSSSRGAGTPPSEKPENRPRPDDDLRKEDNVIYLSDDIDKIKRNHNSGNKD